MKSSQLILVAAIAAMLAGCGKENGKPAMNLNPKDPNVAAKVRQGMQEKQTAAAPRGDASVPLAQYQELRDGRQIVYAYYATGAMPVDFEKITAVISNEYRGEQDEFKKHDLINALKPGITKEIDKAKQSAYYFMEMSDYPTVDKYDFSTQTFKVQALSHSSAYRYFPNASAYKIQFPGSEAFSALKVTDENAARNIENLRLKNGLRLVVYFFVNDTELGQTTLKAEIMRVRLLDKQGTVLAEQ